MLLLSDYTFDELLALGHALHFESLLGLLPTLLQATLVASWLTELYLDQINRALLNEGTHAHASAADLLLPSAEKLGTELQSFLAAHVEVGCSTPSCFHLLG